MWKGAANAKDAPRQTRRLVLGISLVSALSLIGVLSITRGTPVKAVVAIGDHYGPPASPTRCSCNRWSCTPVSISRAETPCADA
jgi:hypothetical protein